MGSQEAVERVTRKAWYRDKFGKMRERRETVIVGVNSLPTMNDLPPVDTRPAAKVAPKVKKDEKKLAEDFEFDAALHEIGLNIIPERD